MLRKARLCGQAFRPCRLNNYCFGAMVGGGVAGDGIGAGVLRVAGGELLAVC
jgi:hypothetical protein